MIYSIITGIIAGYAACKLTDREGKGWLVNLLLGIFGGFLGGLVFDFLGITWGGILGQIGTATIGAILFLWLANMVGKK